MKKTISILLMCCAAALVSAQVAVQDTALNFNRNFTHVSISLEGGLNEFDGDYYQSHNQLWQSIRGGLSGGLTLEYTFNPFISMGLSYYYLPVQANSKFRYLEDVDATKFQVTEATHHQLYPFLSVNLLRVFNKNTHTKWGLWANLGLGAAYFSADYWQFNKINGAWYQTVNPGKDAPSAYSDIQKLPEGGLTFYGTQYEYKDLKATNQGVHNAWAVIVPIGVNIEYNFTKNLALGLKFNYTTYNRDDLEGSKLKGPGGTNVPGPTYGLNFDGVTNDRVASGFVNLRWKFTKSTPHTRNITWNEFDPTYDIAVAALKRANANVPKDYQPQIDKLQDQIDGIKGNVDKLKGDVDYLKKYLDPNGPDRDADGVPDIRDLEPNTPKNTPVDFYGRTMSTQQFNMVPAVFYDFDKYNLDDQALQEIYKAAQIMKANPNTLVELRSYCDYMGNDKYNQKLSINRSNAVKNELVKSYGIDPSRISANGFGRLLDPNHKYRANRRTEFHFSE